MQGKVSGNQLFLLVVKGHGSWRNGKEKVYLRLQSLGQRGVSRGCVPQGLLLGQQGCSEAPGRLALLISPILLPRGSEAVAETPLTSHGN